MNKPCRICGGTKFDSIWRRPRWRESINKMKCDWICFACACWAARLVGLIK